MPPRSSTPPTAHRKKSKSATPAKVGKGSDSPPEKHSSASSATTTASAATPFSSSSSSSAGGPTVELELESNNELRISTVAAFTTYLSYAVLMLFGYIREFFRRFFPAAHRKVTPGYAPLVRDFDDFYTRRLYYRIRDCWNRPVDSRPSRIIGCMERTSDDYNVTFKYTGKIIPCYNLSSYNYLGFADDTPYITNKVLDSIDQFGVASCSSPMEAGYHSLLQELEVRTAEFVGKEAAMVCGMGFATNFGGMPGMFCKDTLVLSDNLNHASLVKGLQLSPCKVKVFPHGNFVALERLIKEQIIDGQPRTHRPWKRIVLVVEGIYSMEGEIIDLAKLVAFKKKYNLLLYVDEAHSIGALGVSGKGICEYRGVNPADIDVLMGTYTKSFGSIGGYISGNKEFIQYLKESSSINLHADSLCPGAVQQALASMEVLLGEDGSDLGKSRIRQLADNSRFFRDGLRKLGLTVYGEDESPVIPMMLYNPSKMPSFSRECLKRNLAVVVVGYPATSVIESRVRFCVSAGHTRQDLIDVLKIVDEVASEVLVRYEGKRLHWFS